MQVSEVLERALTLLEQEGWTQGFYESEDGICPIRAIYRSVQEQYPWNEGGRPLYMRALGFIQRETGAANTALWNDNPERTFEQVREVFRRAMFVAGHELVSA